MHTCCRGSWDCKQIPAAVLKQLLVLSLSCYAAQTNTSGKNCWDLYPDLSIFVLILPSSFLHLCLRLFFLFQISLSFIFFLLKSLSASVQLFVNSCGALPRPLWAGQIGLYSSLRLSNNEAAACRTETQGQKS